jgi:hypothetical protein
MNFLKKGPEIKLSEIKAPGFLQDLYYDLKDRHLLPLAAILLLAIVVVPFALSKSSSSSEESEAGATATVTPGTPNATGSSELVAKSAPGLRDYKRRLDHLKSKNPFHQQYRRGESSEEGSGSSGEGGTTVTAETTETVEEFESSNPGGGPSESGGNGESSGHGQLTYFSYAVDVKVTSGGAEGTSMSVDGGAVTGAPIAAKKSNGKQTVRHNLPELTMLPSRETPALTYMGSTKDGKKALMLVSSDVTSLFGDAKCVIGSSTCQLIALEVGLPETVVYGGNDRTFKIELLKIHLVESDKVNKAPLGKPHKHSEG